MRRFASVFAAIVIGAPAIAGGEEALRKYGGEADPPPPPKTTTQASAHSSEAATAPLPDSLPLPIDLPTTLALAGAESRDVELARARTAESRAIHERTRARFFPWIEPSIGYRRHEGRIQDVAGAIIATDRQAYDVGAALVAEVDLGEALYETLAAKQRVRAAEQAGEAARRTSVAGAAASYLELARAEASVLIAAESVRIAEDYAGQLARAVEIGIAFRGDAHRARARVERNLQLASRAAVERRVAAARLAERLSLDPTIDLRLATPELAIWELVDAQAGQEALVEAALAHRPELASLSAELRAATAEVDAARVGPWLPTLGARAGVYGLGGGEGDALGRFGDGQDYALGLRWRIGPGGLFDTGRHHEAAAREQQALIERRRLFEQIRREVVEARVRALALAEQREMAERMLEAAEATLRLSRDRRAFGVGAVLETLAAEEELTRARLDYVALVAEANAAQLELQRVVGVDPENPSGSDVIPRS